MLYIYLHVLFPGEPNVSRNRFIDLHFFDASLVVYDGLDARLVKHICPQLVTCFASHLHCHGHHSLLASVEILHKNVNKVIISKMCNEYNVFVNIVS